MSFPSFAHVMIQSHGPLLLKCLFNDLTMCSVLHQATNSFTFRSSHFEVCWGHWLDRILVCADPVLSASPNVSETLILKVRAVAVTDSSQTAVREVFFLVDPFTSDQLLVSFPIETRGQGQNNETLTRTLKNIWYCAWAHFSWVVCPKPNLPAPETDMFLSDNRPYGEAGLTPPRLPKLQTL